MYTSLCSSDTKEKVRRGAKGRIVATIRKEMKEGRIRELSQEIMEVCFHT